MTTPATIPEPTEAFDPNGDPYGEVKKVAKRALDIMGWERHEKLIFAGMRNVALGQAAAISPWRLHAILDRMEAAERDAAALRARVETLEAGVARYVAASEAPKVDILDVTEDMLCECEAAYEVLKSLTPPPQPAARTPEVE